MIKYRKLIVHIKRYGELYHLFLTLGGILTGVFLYIETLRQVKITREALEFQKLQWSSDSIGEHRKDSITIAVAETSAAIMRRSAISSERALRAQTNPYVSPTISISQGLSSGDNLRIVVKYDNKGQSPAYSFRARLYWEIGEKRALLSSLRRKNSLDQARSGFTIPPNSNRESPYNISRQYFPELIVQKIINKEFDLKIKIVFEYKNQWGDIFHVSELYTFNPQANEFILLTEL